MGRYDGINKSLSRLGLKTYKDYIASKAWFHRKHYLEVSAKRPVTKCWKCKSGAKLWHHLRYDNLGSELLGRDVIRLCYKCHNKEHAEEIKARKARLNDMPKPAPKHPKVNRLQLAIENAIAQMRLNAPYNNFNTTNPHPLTAVTGGETMSNPARLA